MKTKYEIGGLSVTMNEAQAAAWNQGDLVAASLAGASIHLPGPMSDGNGRIYDLWDFIERSHPEIYSAQMEGMPANPIS